METEPCHLGKAWAGPDTSMASICFNSLWDLKDGFLQLAFRHELKLKSIVNHAWQEFKDSMLFLYHFT